MRILLIIMIGLSFLKADFIRDDIKEIVIDTSTNLMWQDDTNASTITKTWSGAITYCENLNLGGYSNWHLPNMNELYMLADRSKYNPAISNVFHNTNSSLYWSSTTVVSDTSDAWLVNFYYGNNIDAWDAKADTFFVRCVRPSDN